MSIGPISKFVTASELAAFNPAVTIEVLSAGEQSGALHPVREVASGNSYYKGSEILGYLLKLGLLSPNTLETALSAFEYK
jgi:hypothetical protein